MTVNELREALANDVHDPHLERVFLHQLLEFINNAARDAGTENLLIPIEDDESLTLLAATFDYTIPANFLYLTEVWLETAVASGIYTNWVPWNRWSPRANNSVAQIHFDEEFFTVTAGLRAKLRGKRRPNVYTTGSTSLDTGLESYLKSRALWYTASYLARQPGGQEGDQANLAAASFQQSQFELQQLMVQSQYHRGEYDRQIPLR